LEERGFFWERYSEGWENWRGLSCAKKKKKWASRGKSKDTFAEKKGGQVGGVFSYAGEAREEEKSGGLGDLVGEKKRRPVTVGVNLREEGISHYEFLILLRHYNLIP
jgi:hypothetical protein